MDEFGVETWDVLDTHVRFGIARPGCRRVRQLGSHQECQENRGILQAESLGSQPGATGACSQEPQAEAFGCRPGGSLCRRPSRSRGQTW